MLRSSCRVAAMAVLCAGPVAACSDSGVQVGTTPAAAGTPTTSASASTDPRAQAAVDSYLGFTDALNAAQSQPYGQGETFPAAANFGAFSFDPQRISATTYIWGLAAQGVALRGAAPQPHVQVTSVQLKGPPYPTVTLTDCATSTGPYGPVKLSTGEAIPTVTPSDVKAPGPYLATVTVIYYKKHWGVQKIDRDLSRTCSA